MQDKKYKFVDNGTESYIIYTANYDESDETFDNLQEVKKYAITIYAYRAKAYCEMVDFTIVAEHEDFE